MSYRKWTGPSLFVMAVVMSLSLALAGQTPGQGQSSAPPTGTAQAQGAAQPPPAEPAEAVYKNIQVLKGIPAAQLIPTMNFMAASLGVQCNFCHVSNQPNQPDQFEKDDKQSKQTARKMITMTMAINKDSFNGRRQVTCNSCHNGHEQPVPTPVIPQGPQPAAERPAPGGPGGPGGPGATPPPNIDQILDKYVQAIGGAAAIEKISSRVAKGILMVGGFQASIEMYQKAPNKVVMITHTPAGDNVQAYDGETAWNRTPDGRSEEPTPVQLARAKRNVDIHRALHLKALYQRIHVFRMEKVGEREAYLVVAQTPGDTPERMYFDAQSGLLIRTVILEDTPLGANPTQLDFEDYRDVEGVKLPFRIRASTPDRMITYQFVDIQLNVPVDDAKFAKPAGK